MWQLEQSSSVPFKKKKPSEYLKSLSTTAILEEQQGHDEALSSQASS
jgi:hypothetical protein